MAAALVVTAIAVAVPRLGGGSPAVSYAHDVQPIFDAKCTACHPASFHYLDLRRGRSYAQLVGEPSVIAPAYQRVLPGRPELSWLLIHPPDPSRENLLSDAEKDLIARWIGEGARDN